MLDWRAYQVQHEHYLDMLREADNERLVRQARAEGIRRDGVYHRIMRWLASRLIAWGRDLQERYGTASEPRTLITANRAR
jgi:hypothetical protein